MKAFSLFLLTFTSFIYGTNMATIKFTNNCGRTIWPATLTGNGVQLPTTGFALSSKETTSIAVPPTFSGRFWARTLCTTDSTGKFTCSTGDCGSGQVSCNGAGGNPPLSLIEFTLAQNGGRDFYDISLVDGFNLPVSVTPLGGSGDNCSTSSCKKNVNSACPDSLAVKVSDNSSVIACKSACEAFDQPEYCCTGSYSSPSTCKPTNYSMIFKNLCPQAYSYAYDDKTSTFSCIGDADYAITFCP